MEDRVATGSRHRAKSRRAEAPPAYPPATSGTRRCTKCGRRKPITAFPPHKRCRRGRNTQCRDCINAYHRAYHRRHLDRCRAKYRRFYRRHKERVARREERLDRQAKNDIRQLVRLAVRTGLLEKPDRCEQCGARPPPHRLHAHHPDYSRPLDVRWLCSLCHGQEHRRLRR
jgi:hypothetical protein